MTNYFLRLFVVFAISIAFFSSCKKLDNLQNNPNESQCQSMGFTDCAEFAQWYSQMKTTNCGVHATIIGTEPFDNQSYSKVLAIVSTGEGFELRATNSIFAMRARALPNHFFDYQLDFIEVVNSSNPMGGTLKEVQFEPHCPTFAVGGDYFYIVSSSNGVLSMDVVTSFGLIPNLCPLNPGEKIEGVYCTGDKGYPEKFTPPTHVMAAFYYHYVEVSDWQNFIQIGVPQNCTAFDYYFPVNGTKVFYTPGSLVVEQDFGPNNIPNVLRTEMKDVSFPDSHIFNPVLTEGDVWWPGAFFIRILPVTAYYKWNLNDNPNFMVASARRCMQFGNLRSQIENDLQCQQKVYIE